MRKSRRLYKTNGLPTDTARCWGSKCQQKESCERFIQIDRDKEIGKLATAWWTPYTDVSTHDTEHCELKIEVEQ